MKNAILLAIATTALLSSAATAGPWVRHHPARAQIHARSNFQQERITHERVEGDLTHQQAMGLRQQIHGVNQQARSEAMANGGHLTPDEARQLHQQQNAIGQQIPH